MYLNKMSMGIEIINREALYSYSRWLMWGVEIQGGSIIILHMEEYLMKCAYCDNWEKDTAENSED